MLLAPALPLDVPAHTPNGTVISPFFSFSLQRPRSKANLQTSSQLPAPSWVVLVPSQAGQGISCLPAPPTSPCSQPAAGMEGLFQRRTRCRFSKGPARRGSTRPSPHGRSGLPRWLLPSPRTKPRSSRLPLSVLSSGPGSTSPSRASGAPMAVTTASQAPGQPAFVPGTASGSDDSIPASDKSNSASSVHLRRRFCLGRPWCRCQAQELPESDSLSLGHERARDLLCMKPCTSSTPPQPMLATEASSRQLRSDSN